MITVVTGLAASAGADIMAAGDYAIAYPHALIHYHGVRTSLGEITHESASTLAEALKQSNEGFALELADRIKRRFFFVYTQLKSDFHNVADGDEGMSTVECLVRCMTARLSSSSKLLRLALDKHKRLNALLAQYNERLHAHVGQFDRPADKEAFLIRFLVEWELQENAQPAWRFGPKGLNAIREDFVLLADYEDGQHMRDLDSEIRDWGHFLLEGEHREKFLRLTGEEAIVYLKAETKDTFRAVWHFLVSVCRALQQGENQLSPQDAYWLGLVDEVPGSGLYTLRDVFENYQELEQSSSKKSKVRSIAASAPRKTTKKSLSKKR